MAEIGDVCRFERKQALVAFAGIDPMPNQSGEKYVRSNKSSKRGSPYLRKTLFDIMMCLHQSAPADEPAFQFLDRKRSEGKPYYVYMMAGANKFLRRYYAKVRDYLATLDDLPPMDTDSTGLPNHSKYFSAFFGRRWAVSSLCCPFFKPSLCKFSAVFCQVPVGA